jgi:recombination protein RecA
VATISKELSSVLKGIAKASPKMVKDPATQGRIKRIMLESPQLNYAFGGGFPVGRIIQLFGPFSSGKSSISNYIGGQLQKLSPEGHRLVVYADFERSFDTDYATENGLDCTDVTSGGNLLFLRPDSIEEFIDTCQQLVSTGEVALIILDSEAAAPTKVMMTNEAGKACVAPDTLVEFWTEA